MDNINLDKYDFVTLDNTEKEIDFDLPELELGIINILMAQYNKQNGSINTAFDKIDYEKLNSTNRQMEYIYDNIINYKEGSEDDKLLISNNDINNYNKIYILSINDKIEYGCKLLLPLIIYLSNKDWLNCIWDIEFKD